MKEALPSSVKACLWSYDTNALDLIRDKRLIILHVLNHGGMDAVRWLRSIYSDTELAAVISGSARSEWSAKSLNYWSGMFGTTPERTSRFA